MTELTDRTPEIEALVKLGKSDEAKSRARRWADEVPQDYRAHLAAALAEVDFFNCAPVDIYFDNQRRNKFEFYVAQAQAVANAEQNGKITEKVGGFLKTLEEIENFHPVAYSQIEAQTAGGVSEISNLKKRAAEEKTKAETELVSLKSAVSSTEKNIEMREAELLNAREYVAFIEKEGPKEGSFFTKKKRESEFEERLSNQKAVCVKIEKELDGLRARLAATNEKIGQLKAAIKRLDDDLRDLNAAEKQERERAAADAKAADGLAPWRKDFVKRLKAELKKLDQKRRDLDYEKKELEYVKDDLARGYKSATVTVSTAPGGLADMYRYEDAARGWYNSKHEDERRISSNIANLAHEISYLEKFLCKKSAAGGDASVKGGN